MEILKQPKYQDPKKLNQYENRVFSQSGEDGIITEIFRREGLEQHGRRFQACCHSSRLNGRACGRPG